MQPTRGTLGVLQTSQTSRKATTWRDRIDASVEPVSRGVIEAALRRALSGGTAHEARAPGPATHDGLAGQAKAGKHHGSGRGSGGRDDGVSAGHHRRPREARVYGHAKTAKGRTRLVQHGHRQRKLQRERAAAAAEAKAEASGTA